MCLVNSGTKMKNGQESPRKILWISNHPTIYIHHLFDSMKSTMNVDLIAAFRKIIKTSHPWKREFEGEYVQLLMAESNWRLGSEVWKELKSNGDLIVIGGWNCQAYIFSSLYCTLTRKNFAVYTDTPEYTSGLKMFIKRLYLKFMFAANKRFTLITTGNIGVEQAIKLLDSPRERTLNFPWVTDNDYFQPRPRTNLVLKKERTLTCVGRIDFGHKGQDIAIRASSYLVEMGYRNFKLIFCGTGRDESRLKDLIKDKGLEERVELRGWLEANEIRDIMRESDFLIHPSHFDPYPNSVLEALSCGIPVLGSDAAGSVVDRVQHGINGYIH